MIPKHGLSVRWWWIDFYNLSLKANGALESSGNDLEGVFRPLHSTRIDLIKSPNVRRYTKPSYRNCPVDGDFRRA
ncbi:MAG: hypothetical protein SGI77_07360 [Pirellulaceae bacterium]|nr:hypothetical protein [Pirellulaceae bacterium]